MGQFSVLILFLLAVAFLLRIDFIFYIIYVCVGIYAWSWWYAPRALRRLDVARDFVDHAFYGETVTVTLRLTNRNWLPLPWIQFHESIAVELAMGMIVNKVFSLRIKESAEFNYHVKAARRGYYRLGPMRLTVGDLFGLIREQQRELPAGFLTVYPRIVTLSQLGLRSRLPFGTVASSQRLFEDPARPMGVRDFRAGDPLRQINWKVSAHTNNLVVKTLEPAVSLETAILLNLHAVDYHRRNRASRIEWAVTVAASLATHLVDQRQSVGLSVNGIDPLATPKDIDLEFDEISGRLLTKSGAFSRVPSPIPPRSGRAHLMKILEQLARIDSGDTTSFQQWTPKACTHLNWGVTIIAITAQGDEETCQALHRLVRTGYNPVLIVIEPDYNFGQVRKRARRLGFAAYNITVERDLDRWRRPKSRGR